MIYLYYFKLIGYLICNILFFFGLYAIYYLSIFETASHTYIIILIKIYKCRTISCRVQHTCASFTCHMPRCSKYPATAVASSNLYRNVLLSIQKKALSGCLCHMVLNLQTVPLCQSATFCPRLKQEVLIPQLVASLDTNIHTYINSNLYNVGTC